MNVDTSSVFEGTSVFPFLARGSAGIWATQVLFSLCIAAWNTKHKTQKKMHSTQNMIDSNGQLASETRKARRPIICCCHCRSLPTSAQQLRPRMLHAAPLSKRQRLNICPRTPLPTRTINNVGAPVRKVCTCARGR